MADQPDTREDKFQRQIAALDRKIQEILAQRRQTEAERDKAEQALRSLTRELAQSRSRLRLVEAELASLRPGRRDGS